MFVLTTSERTPNVPPSPRVPARREPEHDGRGRGGHGDERREPAPRRAAGVTEALAPSVGAPTTRGTPTGSLPVARSRREIGSTPSSRRSLSSRASRSLLSVRRAAASASVSRTYWSAPPSAATNGVTTPPMRREALLPHGILDDDRRRVPASVDRRGPALARRRLQEVRDDEDEASDRDGRGDDGEEPEALVERVRRRVEAAAQVRLELLDEVPFTPGAAVRPRRAPERCPGVVLRFVACVVEVADEAALVHRADARSARRSARPPAACDSHGSSVGIERHLRPPVADDHDSRHLVRVALADDELVVARDGREPGRGLPVDRVAQWSPGRYGREPATSEP